jgi:hypothetical protein
MCMRLRAHLAMPRARCSICARPPPFLFHSISHGVCPKCSATLVRTRAVRISTETDIPFASAQDFWTDHIPAFLSRSLQSRLEGSVLKPEGMVRGSGIGALTQFHDIALTAHAHDHSRPNPKIMPYSLLLMLPSARQARVHFLVAGTIKCMGRELACKGGSLGWRRMRALGVIDTERQVVSPLCSIHQLSVAQHQLVWACHETSQLEQPTRTLAERMPLRPPTIIGGLDVIAKKRGLEGAK